MAGLPSKLAPRALAAVAVTAIVLVGVAGAVSYGRDYNLHRGFATLVQFRRAGRGRLQVVHFFSPALHRRAEYLVYLPPHYSPARRLPVFYLLHGAPGQPRVFIDIANMDIRLDNQLSLGRTRPMILVYPDGRIGGSTFSDSEWANTRAGRFESYVLDVMHNVDSRFATLARRQDRVIGGFSAGAYGAMNIALHHLADFANVQSWSGYFIQTRTGVFANASRAALAHNSPLSYVRQLGPALRRYPLRVLMFVGRDDSSSSQQLPMARALITAGAHVRYRLYPGGHDWSVWYPRLNGLLDAASRDFAHPPSRIATVAPARLSRIPVLASSTPTAARRSHRHHRSELGLIGALLLALLSAGLINLGFVMQHRGHQRARRRDHSRLTSGFREPAWLLGQMTGWAGFAGQIFAVALAPLTLVQAFSAGSLAVSVPVAARALGHRVTPRQFLPIGVIAISLASLPVGFGGAHGQLRPGLLIAAALLVMLAGAVLARRGGAAPLAVLAGGFYGAADGAIKAAAIGLRFHGSGLLTGWTVLAALCTFGGFLAFQGALRAGDAVGSLSLMNAFTALAAIVLGIVAFGERLGSGAVPTMLHLVAIAAVLLCVRPLTAAQHEFAEVAERPAGALPASRPGEGFRVRKTGASAAGALLGTVASLIGVMVTIGLAYTLRGEGLLAAGPRVPDALPLLQLAGFDAQPLLRITVAAALAGLAVGLALTRIDRPRRIMIVGLASLLLLLIGSDASFALARNLRFERVLLNRTPPLGPWLEAVLLSAASALPGPGGALNGVIRGSTDRWRNGQMTGLGSSWLSRPRAWVPIVAATTAAVGVLVLVAPSDHARATPSLRPALASRRQLTPQQSSMVGQPARGQPASRRTRPPLGNVLEAALRRAAARIDAPAATAALVRCGHVVWAGATGVLSLTSMRPATNDSLFVLNSAAKTFVSTMIMQEVDLGRLSLDTRLSRFLPQLPNAGRITVRMLLDMTSGLPDYLYNPRISWTISHRPRHRWTLDQLLSGMGTGLGPPSFAPGERYQYSDTNYIALGAILARVSHSSVEHAFQQLLARPLRLTAATFVPTRAAEARIAHPYLLWRNGRLRSQWIPGYGISSAVWGPVFTDGGLAASSLDVATFANALFTGRLLSPTALRELTHIGRGNYGFGIRRRRFAGHRWLGHAGYWAGFAAEQWTDRSRQLTFAAATNVEKVGGGLTLDPLWRAIVLAYDRQRPQPAPCGPQAPAQPSLRS
ncbi:MAG TPA: serine hydrolase [Solirubrobacteraceae bacterium]|nr:serine hydrolase [Solirubrobacteraceae bacterium]